MNPRSPSDDNAERNALSLIEQRDAMFDRLETEARTCIKNSGQSMEIDARDLLTILATLKASHEPGKPRRGPDSSTLADSPELVDVISNAQGQVVVVPTADEVAEVMEDARARVEESVDEYDKGAYDTLRWMTGETRDQPDVGSGHSGLTS